MNDLSSLNKVEVLVASAFDQNPVYVVTRAYTKDSGTGVWSPEGIIISDSPEKPEISLETDITQEFPTYLGTEFLVKTRCYFGTNPNYIESAAIPKVLEARDKPLVLNNGVTPVSLSATTTSVTVLVKLDIKITPAHYADFASGLNSSSLLFRKVCEGVTTNPTYSISARNIVEDGAEFQVVVPVDPGETFLLDCKFVDMFNEAGNNYSNAVSFSRIPNASFTILNPNSIHNKSKIVVRFAILP